MDCKEDRTILPNVLARLVLKRSALFIQKLVLFEDEAEDEGEVRHYDYDCEGLETLLGFFRKKQQSLLLRAFQLLKALNAPQRPAIYRGPVTERIIPKGNTRRTNINTTFTASDASPIKKFGFGINQNYKNRVSPQSEESSMKLNILVSRLKAVNGAYQTQRFKTEQLPHRDSGSFYMDHSRNRSGLIGVNYYQYYQSQQMSVRNSRRQFILEKFNQIQSNLSELQGGRADRGEIMKEIRTLREHLNNRRSSNA